ncbi:MFS transporter [Mycobacterium antarcticum]|uniref:MFS transporter n=1 Tax=Mycolicibacterium sp. TUM20984 TaxID=3023368 RepID=UPI002390C196|nr:MFS transporter [Mycolicibacterium sp. TUM20984]GLP82237.1 MFS transporter [Mycolicibacterium sp. TUM20984]
MADTITPSDQDIDSSLAALSKRARVWLLVVACLAVSMVISSMVALNSALPDIAVETSATQSQLTWIIDGYTLVLACLLLPAGAIGDRYGRRGALLIGLAIFSAASLAPIFLDGPIELIIARAVAGAGAAFIMPATLSLLTAAYPRAERNKAVGIWAGVAGSGAVLGFLVTGILLHVWSWHSIFWAFAGAGVLLFALACTVSSSRDADAAPLDWIGAMLVGSAVAIFVFGVVEAPARGWSDPLVWGGMSAGVALSAAFTVHQLRRRFPLLDVRLFAKPEFTTGAVGVTLLFFANFGFFFVAMQYIQLVMGYSPLGTAFALAPLIVPVFILSVTASWYLPRVGLRVAVTVGLLLIAAGLVSLRVLEVDSTYVDLAWPLLIMSTGIGLCTAPTTSAIMGAVPDEKQGVASAVNDTTREIGAALGIAVAGSILAAQYTTTLSPMLTQFPEPVRERALGSLAEALAVSEQIGPLGPRLTELARTAFLHAMDSSVMVLAIVIVTASVFIGIWSPGRDGRQSGVVRRLRRIP